MTETTKSDGKDSGARPKVEVRKTVESGQIRQSFSHGRSKAVAVEVKKKRPTAPVTSVRPAAAPVAVPAKPAAVAAPAAPAAKPAAPVVAKVVEPAPVVAKPIAPKVEAAPAPAPAPEIEVAPAQPAPPPAPAPTAAPAKAAPVAAPAAKPALGAKSTTLIKPAARAAATATPAPSSGAKPAPQGGGLRGRVVLKALTDEEKATRARALVSAVKADEEARKRAEIEARRRVEDEARLAVEREAAQKRAAEEEDRKRKEEDARKRGEAEASRRLSTGEPKPGDKRLIGSTALAEEEDVAEVRRKPGAGAALPRRKPPTSTGPRSEPRRRSGKVNVAAALEGEERQRSLAAFRRAREREKRQMRGLASDDAPKKIIREVVIPEAMTVQELANRMAERSSDVIKALMKMGVMATINQTIDADTAELVVGEFGHRLRRVADADVEVGLGDVKDEDTDLLARAPVVTIMGHVDHGKTSLLDALRETDVAGGEAGGITQHIGAYQVELKSGGKITFLDTPGHEAFTAMRARGAKVTDIVVLVVAADDGIMPQTVEALNHAKAANVPIIVAINKIDKPEADANRVRQALLQHAIVVEELGGDTIAVEVSAKQKIGLEKLEETILLQAEVLELKANPKRAAEGAIVEARLDKGRGPVATVLVQRGTLRVGDIVVAGTEWGKVRALHDDRLQDVAEAGPAEPVEVLGLSGTPEAGDEFHVVESEARAREISSYRERRRRTARTAVSARGTLEQMFTKIQAGQANELPILVKTDVQGSLEAIIASASKIGNDEVKVRIVHGAVGGINESDITLAKASNALIVGFNVRANKQARDMATRDRVEIRYYSIIYNLIDDLKGALSGMLEPTRKEKFLGNAEILQVFDISKVGKVAGCRVTEGVIKRGAKVRLLRDNVVIHEGTLKTLKHVKDEVREIGSGKECGMAFENYQDIREGDYIEAFEIEEVARSI